MSAAKLSRVERARMPLAKDVVKAVAIDHGVCVRPVPVRQTDLTTGETRIVDVPCGATFASKCPPCAEKARRLRVVQCREGWHLDHEPDLTPDDPTERQRALVEERAELVELREKITAAAGNVPAVDAVLAECDEEIAAAGVRGTLPSGESRPRRVRSTRRRSDAPDLPRRRVSSTTLGRVFEGRDGRTFRPSLFLTLTLDSYGRVRPDGTPVDPESYDYRRAARDALHFSKLVDRFVQNLRRFVGWDVQYFAAVEPQRRLAPHLHMAIRGTISRAELRQVVAATYAQVWWPPCDTPAYTGDRLPIWDDKAESYVDHGTAEPLPTWDDALDAIGDDIEPVHVARFGPVLDVQGVLAGTPDADRCVRYLAKYLTKAVHECHTVETDAQRAHVGRLVDALRYEPCAPTCANWLRYGVQPKNPRPGLRPGYCRSKAHRAEHLGYAGRRVLVSRKWSAKNLADHRADRRAHVLALLAAHGQDIDVSATGDPGRYAWEPATSHDPDVPPLTHRLMRAIGERIRWKHQYDTARAAGPPLDVTPQAA